jgi:hypothetical protein
MSENKENNKMSPKELNEVFRQMFGEELRSSLKAWKEESERFKIFLKEKPEKAKKPKKAKKKS